MGNRDEVGCGEVMGRGRVRGEFPESQLDRLRSHASPRAAWQDRQACREETTSDVVFDRLSRRRYGTLQRY